MVGDTGFAAEGDADDFLGLVIVKGAKHEIMQGFDLFGISALLRSR